MLHLSKVTCFPIYSEGLIIGLAKQDGEICLCHGSVACFLIFNNIVDKDSSCLNNKYAEQAEILKRDYEEKIKKNELSVKVYKKYSYKPNQGVDGTCSIDMFYFFLSEFSLKLSTKILHS